MTNEALSPQHIPVLLREVVDLLEVQPGGRYIDCTIGAGGHAFEIMAAASPGGRLLGLDADPRAVRAAKRRLHAYCGSYALVNRNFADLKDAASEYGFIPVNGILFDLGMSSLQLEEQGRGFSFQRDDPLDMRFSPEQQRTAADIVNSSSQEELAHLLFTYGEEPHSRLIARRIVENRPMRTTGQLAQLIQHAVPGPRGRIHPATRTFQALRIAVNDELANLESALVQAVSMLGPGGRVAVISYHSLEDRVVKAFFRREATDCVCPPEVLQCMCGHKAALMLITRKPVTPSEEEVGANPRSRSAKLRVAQRL